MKSILFELIGRLTVSLREMTILALRLSKDRLPPSLTHLNHRYSKTMKLPLFTAVIFSSVLYGQGNVIDLPRSPLGDGPFIFDTAEQHKIKVTVITKALDRPF